MIHPIPRIPQIPQDERPRERCLAHGPSCLSLRECLALVLGTGASGKSSLELAEELLERPGPGLPPREREVAFFTALECRGSAALEGIAGLGPERRARILAAFEIGRRYRQFRGDEAASPAPGPPDPDSGPSPENPRSRLSALALRSVPACARADAQEWLGFAPLYRSGRLGGFCQVERGARTHVNVDPAELFARVLALRPAGFFLFHNHPSGDLTPSEEDLTLTRQVRRTAESFGIRLLGHGIVGARDTRWIVL